MALLVLCDPKYRNNAWCDTKLRGIYDDAARRRIPVKMYTDLAVFEAAAEKLGSDSSVIVLFNSMRYLEQATEVLSRLAIHPILSVTESDIRFPRGFSQVCGDLDSAMQQVVNYLLQHGKKRIALLGASRNSAASRNKEEMLRRHAAAEDYAVFYGEGSLAASFDAFFSVRDQFDAAICINDHQAICLIEYLKERNAYDPEFYIVSHGGTILARLYGCGISTVSPGFYACGKAMVETHINRLKYGWSSVKVMVNCDFNIRGSSGGAAYSTVSSGGAKTLRSDVLQQMARLERVLYNSDLADLKLMYGLLCGYSYERIGELCFLSAGAVKYRVQQMRTALGCENKSTAVEMIRTYIDKDNLLHAIEEFEGIGGKVFS